MKSRFSYFASSTFAASVCIAMPLSSAYAGAIEQLREFISSTKSASGQFSQSQVKRGGKTENSSGIFSFSRPGKFRWEIKKPYEQLMLADGEKSWFYDKDLNQVSVRKTSAALGSTPAAILFGSNELDKEFTLTEAGSRAGLEWLDAIPKSKEAGYDKISIGFLAGVPQTIEIRDSFGQTSLLSFKAMQRNVSLDGALFKFTPPAGADVVEQ
jgi:outer membrane lipoprotein carrier protein